MHRKGIYEILFKRLFDFFSSFIAIIIFSPVLIIIALLVRFKLGAPVLFRQDRPGKNEKIFQLLKFRTMTNKTDANGKLLSDDQRLTKFGKLLRSTSLDELPSLFNILIGHMSLVGPRPLLVSYLPLYNESQKRRHEVKPGLTGFAQINGRNELSWSDRFKLDVQYVENITFIGDVKILLKTVIKVIRREGISSTTSHTMEAFKGMEEIK